MPLYCIIVIILFTFFYLPFHFLRLGPSEVTFINCVGISHPYLDFDEIVKVAEIK